MGCQRSAPAAGRKVLVRLLAALGAAILLTGGGGGSAHAQFEVHSPVVEPGSAELESRFSHSLGDVRAGDDRQHLSAAISYGVNRFWSLELEGEAGRAPDAGLRYRGTSLASIVHLTSADQFWLNTGMRVEYALAARDGGADSVSIGPLLQKQIGPAVTTLNLFLEREVGARADGDTRLSYGFQTRLEWLGWLDPGVEVFGEVGDIGPVAPAREQQHWAGPVLFGALPVDGFGAWQYEAGYLFGLTGATPSGTLKLALQYQIPL